MNTPGGYGPYLKRLTGFVNLFLGMMFAWLLLLVSRWTCALLFPVRDPIQFKLITLVYTFPIGFLIITVLQIWQDNHIHLHNDEELHLARAQLNECTGIAIGTAIEHLFAFTFKTIRQDVGEHGRVKSWTDVFGRKNAGSDWLVNAVDVLLLLLTLPVWRFYIIHNFLDADDQQNKYILNLQVEGERNRSMLEDQDPSRKTDVNQSESSGTKDKDKESTNHTTTNHLKESSKPASLTWRITQVFYWITITGLLSFLYFAYVSADAGPNSIQSKVVLPGTSATTKTEQEKKTKEENEPSTVNKKKKDLLIDQLYDETELDSELNDIRNSLDSSNSNSNTVKSSESNSENSRKSKSKKSSSNDIDDLLSGLVDDFDIEYGKNDNDFLLHQKPQRNSNHGRRHNLKQQQFTQLNGNAMSPFNNFNNTGSFMNSNMVNLLTNQNQNQMLYQQNLQYQQNQNLQNLQNQKMNFNQNQNLNSNAVTGVTGSGLDSNIGPMNSAPVGIVPGPSYTAGLNLINYNVNSATRSNTNSINVPVNSNLVQPPSPSTSFGQISNNLNQNGLMRKEEYANWIGSSVGGGGGGGAFGPGSLASDSSNINNNNFKEIDYSANWRNSVNNDLNHLGSK